MEDPQTTPAVHCAIEHNRTAIDCAMWHEAEHVEQVVPSQSAEAAFKELINALP